MELNVQKASYNVSLKNRHRSRKFCWSSGIAVSIYVDRVFGFGGKLFVAFWSSNGIIILNFDGGWNNQSWCACDVPENFMEIVRKYEHWTA